MNTPFVYRNLSDHAYEAVVDLIRNRKLVAGNTIIESRLCEAFGISRTPLREALQRLEGEGMIKRDHGRSYMVRRVELAEYLHCFKVREILEIEAAVMAIGRIPLAKIQQVKRELEETLVAGVVDNPVHWFTDDDVHGLYINHCGNPVMRDFLRRVRTTTRLFDIDKLQPRIAKDYAEHLRIVEALEQQDSKMTVKAIKSHFRSIISDALSL